MLLLNIHASPVNAVVFSADGRWLASAGDDGDIWLTDLHLKNGRQRIAWGAKYVFALDLSPDSRLLAAATDASLLLLQREGDNWRPVMQRNDHRGWVTSVSFDPTGQVLASGGVDGVVRLWNATRGQRHPWRLLQASVGPIRSVRFSPDGRFVAAAGATGLAVWHPLGSAPCFVHRFRNADARSVAFSSDGRFLWTATSRSILQLDLDEGDIRPLLAGDINAFRCVQTCPRGDTLLIGRDDGRMQYLELHHASEGDQAAPRHNPCHGAAVNAVAFHPEGRLAATAGDDNCVCICAVEAPVLEGSNRQ